MGRSSMAAVLMALLAVATSWGQEKPGGKKEAPSHEAGTHRMWVGLQIGPLSDKDREDRKLGEDEGILVREVLPDSPAAKAGLKADDVIVKVGKKAIGEPAELIGRIQESKGKSLAFEVLRDGKRQTFKVTPAAAPTEYREVPEPRKPGRERPFGGPMESRPFWRLFGGREVALPDDMTVTVTKTGEKPAEIVVKQGDKKWEATEKDLDRLPENVRPYAEHMLGRGPGMGPRILIAPPGEPGQWSEFPHEFAPGPPRPGMEKRLEELNKRIDKLQSMVEDLRKERAQPKK